MYKWGISESHLCDYSMQHMIGHIVDICLQTRFDGQLKKLHRTEADAVNWLENLEIKL